MPPETPPKTLPETPPETLPKTLPKTLPELILHLGDHKTGTSALQAALAQGRIRIAGQAPHYPGQQQHRLARHLMVRRPDPALWQPIWDGMVAGLPQDPGGLAVFSSEHFEYVDPAHLAAALDHSLPGWPDRVRLVAWVRPHVDRLLASFIERRKMGLTDADMAGFITTVTRQGMLDYTPRVQRWRDRFGDRFTLRPYLRDRMQDGDVVADFAAWAAAGRPWQVTAATRANESLSLPDLAQLGALQDAAGAAGLPKDLRSALGWNLGTLMGAHPQAAMGEGGVARPALPRDLILRLADQCAADAAALDAAFFAEQFDSQGGPMAGAIAAARARADSAPRLAPDLTPAAHLSPAARSLADAGAATLLRIGAADAAHLAWAIRPPGQRRARFDMGAATPGPASPAGLAGPAGAPATRTAPSTATRTGPRTGPRTGRKGPPPPPPGPIRRAALRLRALAARLPLPLRLRYHLARLWPASDR